MAAGRAGPIAPVVPVPPPQPVVVHPHQIASLGLTPQQLSRLETVTGSSFRNVKGGAGYPSAPPAVSRGSFVKGAGKGVGVAGPPVGAAPSAAAGGGLQDGQGAQGVVASFNAQKGFGFISCQSSTGADLYFKSTEEIPVGTEVAFYVKVMPDGKMQARDLMAALSEGQTAVGTVNRYVPHKGYGFIRIPDQPNDVHFRKDVVPPELQDQELEGKTVRFTVTLHHGKPQASTAQFLARPPPGYVAPSVEQGIKRPAPGGGGGMAHAPAWPAPPPAPSKRPRTSSPHAAVGSSSGRQHVGQMTGWILSFNAMKGFGFIQSPTSTNGDVYFKALNLPAGHQQRSDLAGVEVAFQGSSMPDGKLQANSIQVIG